MTSQVAAARLRGCEVAAARETREQVARKFNIRDSKVARPVARGFFQKRSVLEKVTNFELIIIIKPLLPFRRYLQT